MVGLHTLRTLENMVANRNSPVCATRWGQVTAGSSGGPKVISSQTSMFDLLCFYHLPSREPFLVRYPITSTCAYQSVETLMINPGYIRLGLLRVIYGEPELGAPTHDTGLIYFGPLGSRFIEMS